MSTRARSFIGLFFHSAILLVCAFITIYIYYIPHQHTVVYLDIYIKCNEICNPIISTGRYYSQMHSFDGVGGMTAKWLAIFQSPKHKCLSLRIIDVRTLLEIKAEKPYYVFIVLLCEQNGKPVSPLKL